MHTEVFGRSCTTTSSASPSDSLVSVQTFITRSLRTVKAQQLSSSCSIGANKAADLLGSGIFTRQQQQRLQILSLQLVVGVPDSQSLLVSEGSSERV